MNPIAVQRLYQQRLIESSHLTPAQAIAELGAVQGQDYPGAKWSLGLRVPGSTDASIEQAVAERSILRSWVLRGTLHLVAAADIHWLLALLAPRVIATSASRYRELELDEPTLTRACQILVTALQDGQERDRAELFAILQGHGIATDGQRGVHLLMRASLERLICQVGVRRNRPIFIALASPTEPLPERDEALAELARRYFTSHGPATLQDFVWWSGLTVGDARSGLAASCSVLRQETVDERTLWMAADLPERRTSPPAVLLLPGFDEFLISYRDRSDSITPQQHDVWVNRNGVFRPTLVRDGKVVGLWRRTLKKGAVVITLQPFVTLQEHDHLAIHAAAQRVGAFLEAPVVVTDLAPR